MLSAMWVGVVCTQQQALRGSRCQWMRPPCTCLSVAGSIQCAAAVIVCGSLALQACLMHLPASGRKRSVCSSSQHLQ